MAGRVSTGLIQATPGVIKSFRSSAESIADIVAGCTRAWWPGHSLCYVGGADVAVAFRLRGLVENVRHVRNVISCRLLAEKLCVSSWKIADVLMLKYEQNLLIRPEMHDTNATGELLD